MNKVTVIAPAKKWQFIDWRELWRYRELFLTFVERDIRVRYKQTIIGGAWAIMQPLFTMIVFSFFFGKLAKIPSEGVPYPVFSYAGLLLWTYFSTALSNSSNSLVGSSGLITKVYFPRLIIPLSASLTPLFDYAIATTVMFGLLLYFQLPIYSAILLIPIIAIITWVLATGVSLWLSALNVKYRDIKFLLGFLMQLWIYATPVIYPASVAERFRYILLINPMTGLIETHRALILGNPIPWQGLGISVILTTLIFLGGIFYFKKVERTFADLI
jgi:lipopolysaccharide transport system permease protein